MSLFKPSGPTPPQYTGIQVSTSTNLIPIPICYGSPYVASNLILGVNFKPNQNTSKKSSKGGSATNAATIDAILAFGEWPASEFVSGALTLRFNGQYYPLGVGPGASGAPWKSFDFNNSNGGPPYGFNIGVAGDFANPGLTARAYPGTVLMRAGLFTAGTNASAPQIEVQFYRKFAGSCPLNYDASGIGGIGGGLLDADPAQCVVDVLTHLRYGAGFPLTLIDPKIYSSGNFSDPIGINSPATNPAVGSSDFQTYCQAALSVGFSVSLRSSEAMSSILDRWTKLLVTAVVWNGLILRFIPYWDSYASSNRGYFTGTLTPKKYFQPNLAPLFDLGDDDILQAKERDHPIELNRADPADIYNVVRVAYKDRSNQYNSNTAEAKDENQIETGDLTGALTRVEDVQAGEEFTFLDYAQAAAQAILNRNLSVRNTGTFALGWDFFFLDPMDVLTISDPTLGLNRYPIRITSIEEKDDFTYQIGFEEFPIGSASPAIYHSQNNIDTTKDVNVIPASVNPPLFCELPPAVVSAPTLDIVLSGGTGIPAIADPNWGGAQIWMSLDGGNDYEQIGTLTGASTMGRLTGTLAAYFGVNPDNSNTLAIDTSMSDAVVNSVTTANAAAARPLSVIIDAGGRAEFLSFQLATITGATAFNLTKLYRGLYGSSSACNHAAGALFATLDSHTFSWLIPDALMGVQLWFKFLSFNIYGNSVQALSAATPYSYTPGAVYVSDVCTGSTYTLVTQPSFVSTHIGWRSATTTDKTQSIPGATNMTAGFHLSINDSQGTAGDYPITITPASGTIMGQATAVVSAPYGSIRLTADPVNNDWVVV